MIRHLTVFITVLLSAAVIVSANLITPQLQSDADKIIDTAIAAKGHVWNRLADTCDTFGPRFSGTQALEDAIDDILNKIKNEDGLDVQAEPVMIPKWVRGNEYARMVKPRSKMLHMTGLGMSVGTPNSLPITAPILVVNSFDDLAAKADQAKGKIVVYNVPWVSYGDTVQYRVYGATEAAKYGAVAALVRSIAPYGIQTVHTGVSATASIPSAAITLEDALQLQRFHDKGVEVVIELLMEAHQEPDVPSRNVVITLPGSEKPDEFVVIGGHIDSWDIAEGAMDDGGGGFVCWEALRLIKQLGLRPKRSIRSVFFVNEENGARGAAAFLAAHLNEVNSTSIAIESDVGTFSPFRLGFSGNETALPILRELGQLLERINAGNVTVGGGGTDIDPLCQHGVPCASMQVLDPRVGPYANNPCLGFSDGFKTYTGEISDGYFWYHHTSADTVDKLNPEQLQLSAAAMAVWAYSIANLPDLLPR